MTKDELIAFEDDLAATFERGEIKAPLHLAGGNEDQLIDIFRSIKADDWVLCSWRSHYHCLLKGVPPDDVRQAIMRGRSIGLCFPEQRVLSSAIVGGIGPIATGLGWAIKRSGKKNMVHVFVGDMTAETGIIHEAMKYCSGEGLPVRWIVEDNGLSVCTKTDAVWKKPTDIPDVRAICYQHTLTKPHVGTGLWVSF